MLFDDQAQLTTANVELADLSSEDRFQERGVIGELSNKLKLLGIDSEPIPRVLTMPPSP